jgi:hypothetical protein
MENNGWEFLAHLRPRRTEPQQQACHLWSSFTWICIHMDLPQSHRRPAAERELKA